MNPFAFLDKAFRAVLRTADRCAVPLANRRLSRLARAEGDAFLQRVEIAIERGIAYLARLPGLEKTTFVILQPLLEAGLEPRLCFVNHWLDAYRQRFNDPDLRLFDPNYDPDADAREALPRVHPNHPINAIMHRCIYADRLKEGEDLVAELEALEDGGWYGTTHVLWGALLLERFSPLPRERLCALAQRSADVLVWRQRVDRPGDLFAERIVMLQWLGRHNDVEPAWIARLVRSQQADGGWARMPSLLPQFSNQHTTALSVAALVQYRAHRKGVCARPVLGTNLHAW